MKKQIITIVSVAVAAILLFSVYAIFLRDNGIESVGDPFYTLTESTKAELAETDEKVEIVIWGYNASDTNWEMVYRFASAIAAVDRNISLKTELNANNGFKGVCISANGESVDIPIEDFFKVRYDGKLYAFDGEALICNSIFQLTGREKQEIPLRALENFDIYGDDLAASGAPLIFPTLERKDISYLTISNQHGEYSVYQEDGNFYFRSSRAIAYDDDKFSYLSTSCRNPVSYGKMEMPADKSWEEYGIKKTTDEDGKETIVGSNGHYTLITNSDSNGNYTIHTVYIGDKASAGYYYARYVGGIFKPSGKEDVADTLVTNISKDMIYFFSPSAYDGGVGLPQTDIMSTKILNALTDATQLQSIGDIRIDLYKDGVNALAKNITYFQLASNLVAADTSDTATKVIMDKKSANSNYGSYEGAWLNNINVFGGFKVTSGTTSYLIANLSKQSKTGEYRVNFGLVRDETNHAVPPSSFTVHKSYDGTNWLPVDNGTISPDQADKTIKKYDITFTDETPVKYVRIRFDAPAGDVSFVVFDEIRIYGGKEDLQPTDSFAGSWKLVAPNEYITSGYNYSYLDMTNFGDFVQSLAALSGEKVVGCGFSDNGDATPSSLKMDVLAQFGLDNPEKHYSFDYSGVVTDLYVSAKNEEGKYYAYATLTGEINEKQVIATTDVIVELSEASAKWLDWDMLKFMDHSPISIYITDVDQLDLTVDGVEYQFDLGLDADGGSLASVVMDGKNYNVDNFKKLFESILTVRMVGEYTLDESTNLSDLEEYLRIDIHSDVKASEIVFYRVDSSRCYYTVDGVGGYYVRVTDVNTVRENLVKFLNGEAIGK